MEQVAYNAVLTSIPISRRTRAWDMELLSTTPYRFSRVMKKTTLNWFTAKRAVSKRVKIVRRFVDCTAREQATHECKKSSSFFSLASDDLRIELGLEDHKYLTNRTDLIAVIIVITTR